jgi:hypothetical protein
MENYSLTEQEKEECVRNGLKKEDYFESYDPFSASLVNFLIKRHKKSDEDITISELFQFRTTYLTLTGSFPPLKNYSTGEELLID